MTDTIIIKGAKVYGEKTIHANGFVLLQNNKIIQTGSVEELENIEYPEKAVINLTENHYVLPGFIDIHIHGAGGSDVMDSTPEALDIISKTIAGEGTTSFLATTMTQSKKAIENAVENAGNYQSNKKTGQAELLGVHLEGPFISAEKAGAQPAEYILKPDTDLFFKWQEKANRQIKVVTLAPEEKGGIKLVEELSRKGIIASIGHTNATFQEAGEAVLTGASHVTHLFNQMRGLHHREPGVVGAAFNKKELMAEMIVDGIHINPEVVKITYEQKGNDGIILITDAIRAKGLPDGMYDLGGQKVRVDNGKATLPDGTLAGSTLKMNQAVKNMLEFTDATIEDVSKMASVNPAKQLGIFNRKGSLSPGKDADLVVLNERFEVVLTICNGVVAYEKKDKQ